MSAPAEYAWRVERARHAMQEAGVALLLADSGEMLAWLSGYTVSETMYRAVFLPRVGEPWFVLRALDVAPCREASWIGDVAGYADSEDPLAIMAAEIARRGFADARIGADFGSVGFNPTRLRRLREFLPRASFVDMPGMGDSLRWVKSGWEIETIGRAAAVADLAMAALTRACAPGLTTHEAAAIAAGVFLREGADSGETGPIVRAAGNHEFLHGLFKKETLREGDILHVELIPRIAHYGARIMRPFAVGGPTPAQIRTAGQLVALQDAQIAAMRPGARACDVDAILRDGVLRAGLRERYDNVTAYTLGLYCRTPRSSDFSRVFLPGETWPLEEGMVFHVYATAAGLGFSESVVVTQEGGRRLTRTPRRIL